MKPFGHNNLVALTPSFIMEEGASDGSKEFSLGSSHVGLNDLKTMLGINDVTGATARQKLDYIVFGEKAKEMNWKQLRDSDLPTTEQLIKKAELYANAGGAIGDKLLRALINLKSQGILNEEHFIDVVGLIAKDKNVVLQTTLDTDYSNVVAAYVSALMNKIVKDRMKVVNWGAKYGKINHPVTFYIEEFNIPFPRIGNPSSKSVIKMIYDQMRSFGCSMCASTPSFGNIDPTAIQQSDYIFSAKPLTTRDAEPLNKRVGRQGIDVLMNLKIDRNKMPRSQFACIDSNGSITTFYPLPAMSMCQKEEMVKGGNYSLYG
jgi:hypothetical protein